MEKVPGALEVEKRMAGARCVASDNQPGQFQPDNKTSAGRQGLRVAYGQKKTYLVVHNKIHPYRLAGI